MKNRFISTLFGICLWAITLNGTFQYLTSFSTIPLFLFAVFVSIVFGLVIWTVLAGLLLYLGNYENMTYWQTCKECASDYFRLLAFRVIE